MWFSAREIAFEGRTADVDIDAMLKRRGFGPPASGPGAAVPRILPSDIDENLELIAKLMVRVLLIEVQAFHTFAWAEDWLSAHALVAGEGRAADLVSYIRADETPHVSHPKATPPELPDPPRAAPADN